MGILPSYGTCRRMDLFLMNKDSEKSTPKRLAGRPRQTVIEALMKSTARSIGSSVGRQIIRGILGSILGGKR